MKQESEKLLDEVTEQLGEENILCQLSEECAELIQACLKYNRVKKGLTPKTHHEALMNLLEEIGDVQINIYQVIQIMSQNEKSLDVEGIIEEGKDYKAKRWHNRTFISQDAGIGGDIDA